MDLYFILGTLLCTIYVITFIANRIWNFTKFRFLNGFIDINNGPSLFLGTLFTCCTGLFMVVAWPLIILSLVTAFTD